MGGRPLTALAIAAFPKEGLDHDVIRAIFRGGLEKLHEAGASLLGGHTVQDAEIKFGYAVTGAIDPARVWTNAGARVDDVLFLTKPLGTGIVATALKFDRIDPTQAEPVIQSMRTLNRAASEALQRLAPGDVHACTDVTGFGLLGHASEMAAASHVTLAIDAINVPLFPGVQAHALANRSAGLASNEQHFGSAIRVAAAVAADVATLLYDPQTSGGLLVAVARTAADRVGVALGSAGAGAWRIGEARPADGETRATVR
jgi:selenide,water dikinase